MTVSCGTEMKLHTGRLVSLWSCKSSRPVQSPQGKLREDLSSFPCLYLSWLPLIIFPHKCLIFFSVFDTLQSAGSSARSIFCDSSLECMV